MASPDPATINVNLDLDPSQALLRLALLAELLAETFEDQAAAARTSAARIRASIEDAEAGQ